MIPSKPGRQLLGEFIWFIGGAALIGFGTGSVAIGVGVACVAFGLWDVGILE